MSNNNERFMSAYNRLDNHLQTLVKTNGHVNMIWYLEQISPEKKRSELKTVRLYKNAVESHGVNPRDKKPVVPEEWIQWLLNELEWCKQNHYIIAPKLQRKLNESKKNYNKHDSGVRNYSEARPINKKSPNNNGQNSFIPGHKKSKSFAIYIVPQSYKNTELILKLSLWLSVFRFIR